MITQSHAEISQLFRLGFPVFLLLQMHRLIAPCVCLRRKKKGRKSKKRKEMYDKLVLRRYSFPASPDALGQISQGVGGGVPVNASIGDADTPLQARES